MTWRLALAAGVIVAFATLSARADSGAVAVGELLGGLVIYCVLVLPVLERAEKWTELRRNRRGGRS